MDPLPIAPSCALERDALREQLERYRQIGRAASLVDATPGSLVVDFDRHIDAGLVEATIATERECCPFFDLRWEPNIRRLTISVSQTEHRPALDAIAFALALEHSARRFE